MPKTRLENSRDKQSKRRMARQVAWKLANEGEDLLPRGMVMPLVIGDKSEREAALKDGLMVFRDGERLIRLPLVTDSGLGKPFRLQGVYQVDNGELYAMRSEVPGKIGYHCMHLFEVTDVGDPPLELEVEGDFFSIGENLGHMELSHDKRRMSLGVRSASKAERSVRARHGGRFDFTTATLFEGLYRKLHYRVVPDSKKGDIVDVERSEIHQPFDNLDEYHRIEAIDPKTGKTRVFTFTIDEPREIKKARRESTP